MDRKSGSLWRINIGGGFRHKYFVYDLASLKSQFVEHTTLKQEHEMPLQMKDYLLACISEEAGEITQSVGKAHRFGLLDKNPKSKHTNWVDLRKDVHDLIAVYEMLCDEFDRVETLDRKLIKAKKNKVTKYMGYSNANGRLS